MCKLKPRTRTSVCISRDMHSTAQHRGRPPWVLLLLMSPQELQAEGHLGSPGRNSTQELQGDPSSGDLPVSAVCKTSQMLFWNVCLGARTSHLSWNFVLGSQHWNLPFIIPRVVTFIYRVSPGISGDNVLAEGLQSCRRKGPGAFPRGRAGRPRPWKSPRSIVLFAAQSPPALPPPAPPRGLSFLQCCVSHFTELSSLHPNLPNRIASDMLIFAPSSIFTSVHFQKECLACHRVHSLMIKTEALAVHMPTSDPVPCPSSPQTAPLTSAPAEHF